MRSPKPRSSPQSEAARLRRKIVGCRACARLVKFRESVKPRASYSDEGYWRRPVPGFGDLNARLLIIGLAPAAHGGNRTGRVFTGDSSGRFLVRALHAAGFANRPVSESKEDGLVYADCYLTAAVKCVPPGDRPTQGEFDNCSGFFDSELRFLARVEVVLALGSLAFRAYLGHLSRKGVSVRGLTFGHAKRYEIDGLPRLIASYHPSPRNTNTGRLTEDMLVGLLSEIKAQLGASPPKHN